MHRMHELAGLDLNLLRVLDAVATHKQVTEAARALGLSQSATSHGLARLRSALGDPLFVRGKAGLVFTPLAESLLRATRGALASLGHALGERAVFRPETSTRVFQVLAADGLDISVLPGLLDRLRLHAPAVGVAITRPRVLDIGAMLESGEADLYFGVLPSHELFSGLLPDPGAHALQTAKVYDESWIGLVRRDHPRIKRAPTLGQYAREGHVLYSPAGGGPGVVDRLLENEGLSRRVMLRLPSFHAALECVRRSDFVWSGPLTIAEALDPERELRHFRVPLPLPDYPTRIVWHERYASDPAHRWFREQVIASGSKPNSRETGVRDRGRRGAPGLFPTNKPQLQTRPRRPRA